MRLTALQRHSKSQQKGLTLVELMIAMGLGLLLSAAAMQAFLLSSQTRRTEQALSQLQDSGRIGLQMIGDDIKRAANFGPATPVYNPNKSGGVSISDYINERMTVLAIDSSSDLSKDSIAKAIQGYSKPLSGAVTPTLPSNLTSIGTSARAGSDIITIFYAEPLSTTSLASNYSGNKFALNNTASSAAISLVSNPSGIKQNDIIMLSSLNSMHVIRVTNTPSSTGATTIEFGTTANNTGTASTFSYDADSTAIMRFHQATFYVAATTRTDANNNPIYALYRKLNGNAAEEILEGVEYLKAEYGERLSSGNLRFVTADNITLKQNNISIVRIGLLINDSNTVASENDTKSYTLPGVTTDASGTKSGVTIAATGSSTPIHDGGKKLRRAFISTYNINSRPW
jgi:type IV pilus assembly protein PilW